MNALIKVSTNESLEQIVSTRDLHEKLGIAKRFTDWFSYQAEKLGITEGDGFITILGETSPTGGRPATDYIVNLDTAKHICMMSGGEKAHEIRRYFIEVEKNWNSPEMTMARGMLFANKKIVYLESKLEEVKPLVTFAETCMASKDSIKVGELAKIASKDGFTIGQNRLWKLLRDWGHIIPGTTEPYQRYIDTGYYEVVQMGKEMSSGPRIFKVMRVTPKGQVYIMNRLRKEKAS